MRILRVIASMDPATGGPCQGIRNSIPEMGKLGVHSEVVCMDAPAVSFLVRDSFPVHALGPTQSPWCYSPKLMPWLMENLAHFDVVIVHGLWLYHGYAVRKAMKLLRKHESATKKEKGVLPKLFIMPHGMLDPYFQRDPGRKLKALRNWIYWQLTERKVIQETNGILFTCEEEKRLARLPFHPYRPKQEINIGYGIAEPPSYTQNMRNAFLRKCPELENSRYILFLSRIHEKKGVDLLINAYAEEKGKNAETKADASGVSIFVEETEDLYFPDTTEFPKLVIAGPGLETAYGHRIQQMVSESSNLRTSVFFPGMLIEDAKWGAFYGCEVFALPSHQENFGIAVVEAMACRKPVLISKQVNIWREIEEAGAGKSSDDTQAGIKELLEYWLRLSKEKKQVMGQNARKSFERDFAVGPAAQRLLNAVTS